MDLKIASIAIANNAILVSRNLSDFERIPDLTVNDWTRKFSKKLKSQPPERTAAGASNLGSGGVKSIN